MKVLYAEDEKRLSEAVAEMMKISGYDVDAVYDGRQACEKLQLGSYSAVILDIMMPEMDGLQVLKMMRDHQDYTPVMLLTAKDQIEDRIKGFSVGADDYLGKPFNMQEFIVRLNSMLRRTEIYSNALITGSNFLLNCRTGELTSEISTLRLSSIEISLLAFLMKRPGIPFTTQELQAKVLPEFNGESAIELYLSYLINKMKQLQTEAIIYLNNGVCMLLDAGQYKTCIAI